MVGEAEEPLFAELGLPLVLTNSLGWPFGGRI
jgi:hypothetical protein